MKYRVVHRDGRIVLAVTQLPVQVAHRLGRDVHRHRSNRCLFHHRGYIVDLIVPETTMPAPGTTGEPGRL